MAIKVKFRSLFNALSDGLDDWLEKDMSDLYNRVNQYIKEHGLV